MPISKVSNLRTNMTDAERRLWGLLRSRRLQGYKFRRQHPKGRYVLDFVCLEHRLVIEADGGQHADSLHDERRTALLTKRGWRVLRFWNNEILSSPDGVLETILRHLSATSTIDGPHPPSLRDGALCRPAGEG